MGRMSSILWKVSPGVHDALIKALTSPVARSLSGTRNRHAVQNAMQKGRRFIIDVRGKMGFGASLTSTVILHHYFRAVPAFAGVTVTNPLYADLRGHSDLLSSYFDRLNHGVDEQSCRVPFRFSQDVALAPLDGGLSLREANRLFFRHYRIRPCFQEEANASIDGCIARKIGVHFRGSDKRLEAERVDWLDITSLIESCMEAYHSDELFVASDELGFIDYLRRRYGKRRVSALECKYLSNGVNGAHLLSGDGFEKGREALLTIMLLGMCKVCIRGASHLSAWAKIFNPDLSVRVYGDFSAQKSFPEREFAKL